MKKVISLSMILAAMTTAANAQFFVEGSVSVGYHEEWSFSLIPRNSYFNISPLLGYHFNDRISAGAKASLGRKKEIIMVPDTKGGRVEMERRTPDWSFAVFGRYKLLGAKKISFLVEISAYFSEKKEIYDIALPSTGTKMDETMTSIGVKMTPLVTYDFSNKFSLIAACNFLSLGWSSETEGDDTFHFTRNHFGLSAKSNIFDNLGNIRIGFIYHFNQSSK